MEFNFLYIVLAALIPTVVGFLYYNPKTVGTAWMNASGMTEEKMKGANMGIIFGASILLSFLLSTAMAIVTVHQTDLFSLFNGNPAMEDASSEIAVTVNKLVSLAGDRYLTFKHGAFHGAIISLFLVFPIMATNNFYERRPFKLTLINMGYWTITLALMGGVLCQFGFKEFVAG